LGWGDRVRISYIRPDSLKAIQPCVCLLNRFIDWQNQLVRVRYARP